MRNLIIGIVVVAVLAGGGWYAWDYYSNNNANDETVNANEQEQAAGEPREVEPGLTVQDLQMGEGEEATTGQFVAVYYAGALEDGTIFDQTDPEDPQPLIFQLGSGQVIAGWDRGVQGMRVGGTRRLVVAPELAYGEEGRGPIPPNATLTFDVVLLDVASAEEVQAAQEAAQAGATTTVETNTEL